MIKNVNSKTFVDSALGVYLMHTTIVVVVRVMGKNEKLRFRGKN